MHVAAFAQAAADELQQGSALWAQGCACSGGAEQLLSSQEWCLFVTALGHVHFVALVLRGAAERAAGDSAEEAARVLKGWQRCTGHWQLAPAGESSLAEAHAAACAAASATAPWAPAVQQACEHLSPGVAGSAAAADATCQLSLLPLHLCPGVPTVQHGGATSWVSSLPRMLESVLTEGVSMAKTRCCLRAGTFGELVGQPRQGPRCSTSGRMIWAGNLVNMPYVALLLCGLRRCVMRNIVHATAYHF
jgi:hypothetical protein